MAGKPRTREKHAANKRINDALRNRAANHPSGQSVVPGDPKAVKVSSKDMRERINTFVEEHGYDPFAELVFIAKMNEHVLPMMNGLKELIRDNKCMEEDEIDLVKSVIQFLDECPPDPQMAVKIHQDALKYLAPQLKSSEVKQVVDQTVTINVRKFGGE